MPTSSKKNTKPATPHAADQQTVAPNPQNQLTHKIQELIQLSREKGFLTVQEINAHLPEDISDAEDIENVVNILENLEIDILDEDEVERYKQKIDETEEEKARTSNMDSLDDPVRMYLKQMGQVPLLSRDEEVEISKRIENAEASAQDALFSTSFTLPYQIHLVGKLLARTDRFDRIVSDKKVDSREAYFKLLPKYLAQLEELESTIAKAWKDWQQAQTDLSKKRAFNRFNSAQDQLKPIMKKLFFKLKIFEEFIEQITPDLKQIEAALEVLHPTTRSGRARKANPEDIKKAEAQLEQMRNQYRLEPQALLEITKKHEVPCAQLIVLKQRWLKLI